MSNVKLPTAALSIYCYVMDVDIALGLTSPASFPHFAESFMPHILEAHRDGVSAADLAETIRSEAKSWAEIDAVSGVSERKAAQARDESKAPWYLDHRDGRKEHARAIQTLASVRRALQIVEPDLDLSKAKGMKLAKTLARAARVVDYRMLPVFVMIAEREIIIHEVWCGQEPESTGQFINARLRRFRGLPA